MPPSFAAAAPSPARMPRPEVPNVRHRRIDTGRLHLHVAESGPSQGPVVVLLHGFPEFWYSWRHQLQALGRHGYLAVAPDLRGYGESDKPEDGYDLATLAADIGDLVRALGHDRGEPDLRVTLVGHDWGGVIAYAVAALHPDVVERLVIVNAPHPVGYRRSLWRHPRQLLRSWYILLFQVKGLFEGALRGDPHRMMARTLHGAAGRHEAFGPDEVALYAEALTAPGVLESALAYYRHIPAALGFWRELARPIVAPTLVLWGRKDPALGIEQVDEARRHAAGPFEVRWFDDAGHWLQQEEPQGVSQAIAAWARPERSGDSGDVVPRPT